MISMKNSTTLLIMNVCLLITLSHQCRAVPLHNVPEQVSIERMVAPMVVEFYRPSCGHCQSMAPKYAAVAAECTNGTNFYRVNADNMARANSIASTITRQKVSKVRGVPTFVFVNKNGNTSGDVKSGGMSKQELQSRVAQLQ